MELKEKTISGADAFIRIRNLKLIPGATFSIVFITCDLARNEYGQIRKYENCRIRPAMKGEGLSVNSDHYLYFEDTESGDARQCFKKLIRKIAFPPNNEFLTIKWFD